MTSEMFAGLTLEEARRRAGEIMEQGKGQYTPSSTAELQECIVLVSAGLVTDIEYFKFSNIDLSEVTSQQMNLLLGVVRRSVRLENIKLSASQTEAVFSSMSRLSGGIWLYDGVEIDVAAATEALRGITGRVSGKLIWCFGDSRDEYEEEMRQWAGVLGWKLKNRGDCTMISFKDSRSGYLRRLR